MNGLAEYLDCHIVGALCRVVPVVLGGITDVAVDLPPIRRFRIAPACVALSSR